MSKEIIGDGFHTMDELYEHRTMLFALICNIYKEMAWKSKKHADGTMYDGYFIAGIETPMGTYSYHCEEGFWYTFHVQELDNAPEWDGHMPKDIGRLFTLPTNYIGSIGYNKVKDVNMGEGLSGKDTIIKYCNDAFRGHSIEFLESCSAVKHHLVNNTDGYVDYCPNNFGLTDFTGQCEVEDEPEDGSEINTTAQCRRCWERALK